MDALAAEGLTKHFPGTHAVTDVSFAVPEGAICGLLGPNGAGKTTLVRLFNGVLAPSAGHARVLGQQARADVVATHRASGVLTETAASYEHLDADGNLRFFGRLNSLGGAALDARIDELLRTLDLQDARHRPVRTYSTGMKKRLGLARALLHRPRVLFLDEPTSGLDPEAARGVTRLIQRLARDEGTTVLLCTHQLRYAEEICTLYGLLHRGRLLGFGGFDALAAARGHREVLEVHGRDLPAAGLGGEPHGADSWRFPLASPDDIPPLLAALLAAGGRVYEARRVRWTLEDLYFAYQREGA